MSRWHRTGLVAILPWLLPISTVAGATNVAATVSTTSVRVRLERLRGPVSISGMGLRYSGSESGASVMERPRAAAAAATATAMFQFQSIRVQWQPVTDESGSGGDDDGGRGRGEEARWTLEDRDTGARLASWRAKSLEVSGDGLRLNLKPVPSRLSLIASAKGVDLIANMDVEDYLRGVLPSEMPADWPLEALKAQAVAARTFALYRRESRERVNAPYHLESSVMDQVFSFPLFEEGAEASRANADRAVRETRGLVLQDERRRPFAAYFHADCGGRTEEAAKMWGGRSRGHTGSGGSSSDGDGDGHGRGGSGSGDDGGVRRSGTAIDGACPLNPLARWSLSLSFDEIARRFRSSMRNWTMRGDLNLMRSPMERSPAGLVSMFVPESARVASLELLDRTPSGRVANVRVRWSDGRETMFSGHELRMALGTEKLRSTNFQLKRREGFFEFVGRGFGHGVGLCQWGARHLAMNGKGFRDILKHYYPNAVLARDVPNTREVNVTREPL